MDIYSDLKMTLWIKDNSWNYISYKETTLWIKDNSWNYISYKETKMETGQS